MRVLVVHNDASGFGSDAIFEFQRALLRDGDECVMRFLPAQFSPERLDMLDDAEEFDLVVLSGGDGTVASLMYALRDRDVLACVFPSGTANLFFANLGNVAEPSALARACRVGNSAKIDLGEIMWLDDAGRKHRKGFSVMAGMGFDAQIMQAAVPAKRTIGQAAYFAAALANPKPEVKRFKITVDGVTYYRTGICCLVANSATIQGDIDLDPECNMSDGLLDVIVAEVDVTAQLLHPLFVGFVDHEKKHIGRPHLETFQGYDIRVTTATPAKMEVDGEPIEGNVRTYRARALPAAVRLVVDNLSRYASDEDHDPLFGDVEEVAFPL